jgi:membrane fusion protein, multidrug efflux system
MTTSRNRTFTEWPKYLAASGIVLVSLLGSGCSKTASAPPAMGPPEVAVVTVKPEQTVLTTQLPGRASAYLTAEIRPQVNGIIKSRLFQEGSIVHAGQILYKIDPAPYEAAFGQAKASLATAEADLVTSEANLPSLKSRADRYRELVAIHAVGQQDYDDAEAALRQAQATVVSRRASIEMNRAALESARINLAYTPITAPIAGRIGKSSVTVGALTSSYQGTALATIQQINPVYVDVVQANADLLRLRKSLESGQLQHTVAQHKVKLKLEDGSLYPVEGRIEFRDFTVDPSTGAVTLRMTFANPHEVLLPGMFVQAVVEEGLKKDAILVPQQGVQRDTKGVPFAWVAGADGSVERRSVTLDRAIGDRWLVTAGLAPGEQLIVDGTSRLRVGVKVHTVPAQLGTPAGKVGERAF